MTFRNTGQLNTNEKNPSINEHGNIKIKGNRTVALQSKRYYTRNIAYCSSFTRRGIIFIVLFCHLTFQHQGLGAKHVVSCVDSKSPARQTGLYKYNRLHLKSFNTGCTLQNITSRGSHPHMVAWKRHKRNTQKERQGNLSGMRAWSPVTGGSVKDQMHEADR